MLNSLPISTFWPYALAVLVIGATFAAGCWVGRQWSRRRELARQQSDLQAVEAVELMESVRSWAQGFAGDISAFHQQMRTFQDQLDDAGVDAKVGSQNPLLQLMSEMVAANETLQQKLDDAEHSLLEKAEEVSSYLSEARTDPLTRVANRRFFDDEMTRQFAIWQRYQTPFAVLLVDIDHFKALNDNYGHLAGDCILQQVAATLNSSVRDTDQVSRFGGEEFALILPAMELMEARLAAGRIVQTIEQAEFPWESQMLRVTVSLGVAQILPSDSLTTLIQRADAALYEAKAAGRNCVYVHDGEQALPLIPSQSPLADDPDVPAKFLRVCDDLREKLIEISRK